MSIENVVHDRLVELEATVTSLRERLVSTETNEANALLIVAAVNTYSAHLKAVEALREIANPNHGGQFIDFLRLGHDALRIARAALAAVDEVSK